MSLTSLTEQLRSRENLNSDDIRLACDFLLDESNTVAERAGFLHALQAKGETAEEIAGFVHVLLSRANTVPFSGEGCLDVCGTGGDKAGFFNVSTAVMFVVAACGARVVKHGNRGITSRSGGADVLEALGVRIEQSPEIAALALEQAGCCFLFAPFYHPAFRAVVAVRKVLAEQGIPTIFNKLGPLLNPARPSFQLAGVFDATLVTTYAEVFRLLGRSKTWAVHGTSADGLALDEISPFGVTYVQQQIGCELAAFKLAPADFGIAPVRIEDLRGGAAKHNAAIINDLFAGNLRNGARTIVQINAAAALVVAGIAATLAEGVHRAGQALDDGSARDVLLRLQSIP